MDPFTSFDRPGSAAIDASPILLSRAMDEHHLSVSSTRLTVFAELEGTPGGHLSRPNYTKPTYWFCCQWLELHLEPLYLLTDGSRSGDGAHNINVVVKCIKCEHPKCGNCRWVT